MTLIFFYGFSHHIVVLSHAALQNLMYIDEISTFSLEFVDPNNVLSL